VDGRLEDALAVGESMRSKGEELGIPRVGSYVNVLPLLWLGRIEEFASPAIEGHPGSPITSPREDSDHDIPFRAILLAVSGRVEEASELSRRFKEVGGHGEEGDDTPTGQLLRILALAVTVEDREAAQGLYSRLSILGDQPMSHAPGVQVSYAIPRVLGHAAVLLGEYQAARMHYDKALELFGRMRFRPQIALIHLDLAKLLLVHYPDEHAKGLEHLVTAIAELRDMKMQPDLDLALKLQENLETPKPAAPTYPDGLSAREVEVLRLISVGNSNRQIADELFISVNTVTRHVSNILNKMGASNRTEAASYAVRQGLTPGQ
jgi:DNA-binding CsgD family transcriptional regulator